MAADNRDRLIALIGTWYVEAGKYDVMPVDGSALARLLVERPLLAAPRDRYVYYPHTQSVPYFAAPNILNRPHSITADVEIPAGGAEGVLICQGSVAAGYALFMQDNRLVYVHNYVARDYFKVQSADPVPSGKHELRFEFEPTGELNLLEGKGAPGRLQLYVDGELVGENDVPYTTPMILNPGALTCGSNPGSPITCRLRRPFPVHRNHPQRHRRRERRPGCRHRSPDARGHGPPVVPEHAPRHVHRFGSGVALFFPLALIMAYVVQDRTTTVVCG